MVADKKLAIDCVCVVNWGERVALSWVSVSCYIHGNSPRGGLYKKCRLQQEREDKIYPIPIHLGLQVTKGGSQPRLTYPWIVGANTHRCTCFPTPPLNLSRPQDWDCLITINFGRLIGFVKPSASWSAELTNWTSSKSCTTRSLTKWKSISMCLVLVSILHQYCHTTA